MRPDMYRRGCGGDGAGWDIGEGTDLFAEPRGQS